MGTLLQTFFQIGNPVLHPNIQAFTSNPVGYFNYLIPKLITIGFVFAIIFFFFLFIIGAIQWITAGADKVALENARKRIVNAIIGLVILLLIYFILQLMNRIFGLNIGGLGSGPGAGTGPPSYGSCGCLGGSVTWSNCVGGYPSCNGDACTCVPGSPPQPTLPPVDSTCSSVGGNACRCTCAAGYIPAAGSCSGGYPACVGGACQCVDYYSVYPSHQLVGYSLNGNANDTTGSYSTSLLDPAGDTWVASGCGGALQLNGTNGAIAGPAATMGGAFYAPSFTLAAWINPTPYTVVGGHYREIVVDNNSGAAIILQPIPSTSNPTYVVNGRIDRYNQTTCAPLAGYTNLSSGSLNAGVWHHVVFTYSETSQVASLYIDGAQVATQTGVAPLSYPCGGFTCVIGVGQNCYPGNLSDNYFGTLDQVGIYNYDLSASDITSLFGSCTP